MSYKLVLLEEYFFYLDFVDFKPKIGFVKRIFFLYKLNGKCAFLAHVRSQDVIVRTDMYCSEVSWRL